MARISSELRQGCAYVGRIDFLILVGDYPIRRLFLCEEDFGWMSLWDLNSEVVVSLWLMVSMIGQGLCLATEEKYGKHK